jgi:DNA-binding response OmpR family regulator
MDPVAAKKIIIIEDDDLIRQLFGGELRKSGFAVEDFALGKPGLEALGQNKYDLLLLDIMLPDLNGLAILKEARQNVANKDLRIVMLTNLGQDNIISESYKLGANGFLIKSSYTPEQIIDEIKKMISGSAPYSESSTSH